MVNVSPFGWVFLKEAVIDELDATICDCIWVLLRPHLLKTLLDYWATILDLKPQMRVNLAELKREAPDATAHIYN